MKIFIGSDHRGFELKEKLTPWLQDQGHSVVDCGNTVLDPSDDYVDFAVAVAHHVTQEPNAQEACGISICGSGIGNAIAANRLRGVRCALCISPQHAMHARRNDHANMLSLPAEYVTYDEAILIVDAFLTTQPSSEEKYLRRTQKLDSLV